MGGGAPWPAFSIFQKRKDDYALNYLLYPIDPIFYCVQFRPRVIETNARYLDDMQLERLN